MSQLLDRPVTKADTQARGPASNAVQITIQSNQAKAGLRNGQCSGLQVAHSLGKQVFGNKPGLRCYQCKDNVTACGQLAALLISEQKMLAWHIQMETKMVDQLGRLQLALGKLKCNSQAAEQVQDADRQKLGTGEIYMQAKEIIQKCCNETTQQGLCMATQQERFVNNLSGVAYRFQQIACKFGKHPRGRSPAKWQTTAHKQLAVYHELKVLLQRWCDLQVMVCVRDINRDRMGARPG